ncbi:MAG: hypothetical protein ACOC40_00370 [Thermoplasmatota archaeon]
MDPFNELYLFIILPGIIIGVVFGKLISNFVIRKKNLILYFVIVSSLGILISLLLNPMIILTSGLFLLVFIFRSNEGAMKEFAPVEWVTRGYIKRIDITEEDHESLVSGTQINVLTMIIFF